MTSWRTWANLLTAIRVLVLVPTAYAILHQVWLLASILFTIAVITDIFDGKLARHFNQVSPIGGLFDHSTDAIFVSLSCWALAGIGALNSILWVLIALAFIQYMLDSKALAGLALRMSRLGKINGVAYYVLVGVLVGAYLLDWQWLQLGAYYAGWVLVLTTALSMLDRAVTLLRQS